MFPGMSADASFERSLPRDESELARVVELGRCGKCIKMILMLSRWRMGFGEWVRTGSDHRIRNAVDTISSFKLACLTLVGDPTLCMKMQLVTLR